MLVYSGSSSCLLERHRGDFNLSSYLGVPGASCDALEPTQEADSADGYTTGRSERTKQVYIKTQQGHFSSPKLSGSDSIKDNEPDIGL